MMVLFILSHKYNKKIHTDLSEHLQQNYKTVLFFSLKSLKSQRKSITENWNYFFLLLFFFVCGLFQHANTLEKFFNLFFEILILFQSTLLLLLFINFFLSVKRMSTILLITSALFFTCIF